jgi:hypothetical protein
MAKTQMPADLGQRITQLLQQRSQHETAIAHIDMTLSKVGAALGTSVLTPRRRGRPPGSGKAAAAAAPAPAVDGRKKRAGRRRKRGKFATSGEDSILGFISSNKNPSTQDVNKHWKGEGRGGSADNTLSKLVREKRLKRSSIEGQRGSTYAVL